MKSQPALTAHLAHPQTRPCLWPETLWVSPDCTRVERFLIPDRRLHVAHVVSCTVLPFSSLSAPTSDTQSRRERKKGVRSQTLTQRHNSALRTINLNPETFFLLGSAASLSQSSEWADRSTLSGSSITLTHHRKFLSTIGSFAGRAVSIQILLILRPLE